LRRIILYIFWVVLINVFAVYPGYAASIPIALDDIRVALNTDLSLAEFTVTEGDYELIDFLTQLNFGNIQKGDIWRVTPVGKSSLQVSRNGHPLSKLAGSLLVLKPKNPNKLNVFRFQGKRYRDTLLVKNVNGRLDVINLISVEKYLCGVVGAEIGASAPDEALKAQAVVSRTYALYYKEHPQMDYDVGITTRWQVYGGYDMEVISGPRVKNAVDCTRGQVIYYDGKIIQAFFHANSGGYTENSENVWWAYIPYIRAVPAPEDTYVLNYPVQEGGWPANTYQWNKTFNKQELDRQINSYNRDYPENPVNIGNIISIQASRYSVDPNTSPREYMSEETESRRVTELQMVGTKGSKTFYRDGIRRVFDLRSSMFDVFFDSTANIISGFCKSTVNSLNNLWAVGNDGMSSKINGTSSVYYVQDIDGIKSMPKSFSNLIFSGHGYGHGLGMSQWGARGLAAQGYNYQQIIKHYYNKNNYDGKLTIGLYRGPAK